MLRPGAFECNENMAAEHRIVSSRLCMAYMLWRLSVDPLVELLVEASLIGGNIERLKTGTKPDIGQACILTASD
jgi:hypothetical protein